MKTHEASIPIVRARRGDVWKACRERVASDWRATAGRSICPSALMSHGIEGASRLIASTLTSHRPGTPIFREGVFRRSGQEATRLDHESWGVQDMESLDHTEQQEEGVVIGYDRCRIVFVAVVVAVVVKVKRSESSEPNNRTGHSDIAGSAVKR